MSNLTETDLLWADCAFISAMHVQKGSARNVISRCKTAGLTVIAGGPLFTSEHEEFEEVDHFVLNEAELTLQPFLKDLEQGCARQLYKTSSFADVRKTPAPLWELADLRQYACMSVQSSRGCPFNCDFCNVTALYGHRPRVKSEKQVVYELDNLYNLGWRSQIFFVDDNFISNKTYLKTRLLPALIHWKKHKNGISFNTQATVDLADDELLMAMMVEAGFDTAFIGIETTDEDSLAECNKRQNKNRDLLESVKRIQRAGIQVQGGFIVGFDTDKRSVFQHQIDFIQNSGIVTAMVGLLQAPTGTRLYERLKKQGRLIGKMSGNTDGTTNFIPKMGLDVLCEGYREILRYIYSPKHYYQRVKTFLREYDRLKMEVPLDCQRFLAVFRSIIRLGIFGKERFRYWEILLWTLVLHPKLIPLAVTLTIYGHHFRKHCESRIS